MYCARRRIEECRYRETDTDEEIVRENNNNNNTKNDNNNYEETSTHLLNTSRAVISVCRKFNNSASIYAPVSTFCWVLFMAIKNFSHFLQTQSTRMHPSSIHRHSHVEPSTHMQTSFIT